MSPRAEKTKALAAAWIVCLVPRVVLVSPVAEQTVATQGFYTRSRLIPRHAANVQLQTYDVEELRGNASFVVS